MINKIGAILLVGMGLPGALTALEILPPPSLVSLVQNGSFENPLVTGTGGFDNYTTGQSFGGWTVASGNIDVVRSLREGEVYQGGLHVWPAADGAQSVDLNGYGPGSIYQDIPTIPGQTYELSFALAGNVIGNTPGNGIVVTMDFLWGGVSMQTLLFDTTGHDGFDFGWTYYQFTLVAPGDLSRLTLRSLSTTTGSRGPTLDDVQLFIPVVSPPPAPVPDAGATFWLGLLALGITAVLPRGSRTLAPRLG